MAGPKKSSLQRLPLLPVSRYLKEMEDAGLPEIGGDDVGGNLARLLDGNFSGQLKGSIHTIIKFCL